MHDLLAELETYLRQKSEYLSSLNQLECKKSASEMLVQIFAEFEQQVKQMGTEMTMDQIDTNLKELQDFYTQRVWQFSEKEAMLAEAKAGFLQETLTFYTRSYENEILL